MIKKLDKKEGLPIQTNEFIDKLNEVVNWINNLEEKLSKTVVLAKKKNHNERNKV